jgi:hypothetical protein
MSRLTSKRRQEIVDEYLAESGANQYVAEEFVEWLSGRPEHPAYGWFQWDDGKAGAAYRAQQARQFVNGLRVSFETESVSRGGAVKVSMHTMPAMISPLEGRRSGGGYVPLSGDDPTSMDAYCDEAARALDAWCRRYESAVAHRGGNVNAARKLIALLAPKEDDKAA